MSDQPEATWDDSGMPVEVYEVLCKNMAQGRDFPEFVPYYLPVQLVEEVGNVILALMVRYGNTANRYVSHRRTIVTRKKLRDTGVDWRFHNEPKSATYPQAYSAR